MKPQKRIRMFRGIWRLSCSAFVVLLVCEILSWRSGQLFFYIEGLKDIAMVIASFALIGLCFLCILHKRHRIATVAEAAGVGVLMTVLTFSAPHVYDKTTLPNGTQVVLVRGITDGLNYLDVYPARRQLGRVGPLLA